LNPRRTDPSGTKFLPRGILGAQEYPIDQFHNLKTTRTPIKHKIKTKNNKANKKQLKKDGTKDLFFPIYPPTRDMKKG
jgi:hypothetical protein